MKSELVEELNREARLEAFIEARQEDLVDIANRRFGFSPKTTTEISSILDLERLKRMIRAVDRVDSLDELLAIE